MPIRRWLMAEWLDLILTGIVVLPVAAVAWALHRSNERARKRLEEVTEAMLAATERHLGERDEWAQAAARERQALIERLEAAHAATIEAASKLSFAPVLGEVEVPSRKLYRTEQDEIDTADGIDISERLAHYPEAL